MGTRSGLLLAPLTPRARVRRAPSYGVDVAQRVQVAVDCQDATRLARFWAGVLGYRILGAPGGFESWEAYSRTQAQQSGETWCKIVDPDGLGPSLLFHTVPEPKTVKNRIHLDVRARTGVGDRRRDIDEFVDRILDLGGCIRQAVTDDAGYFVVMEDPEGNEFCVGAGSS